MDLTDVIRFFSNAVQVRITGSFAFCSGCSGGSGCCGGKDQSPGVSLCRFLRFEHALIAGGSRHGKTQLLQQLILGNLAGVLREGKGSIIVIDSQGDLLSNIFVSGTSRADAGACDTY